MGIVFDRIIVGIFLFTAGMFALYSLHMLTLVYLFRRRWRTKSAEQRAFVDRYLAETPEDQWLAVTTQLPIYNEADVATRIIRAVAAMDYPRPKHFIQVLDDSTDETRMLVDRTVRQLRDQRVNIEVLRREKRQGFKAGALREGTARVRTPLIAIFDADFVPPKDFLKRGVPLLARNERLACLQGRWAHINANESWLTKAQAVALDGHFVIEQGARAWNDMFMNFNGTAGIWRKAAIEDPAVGGWSADTLTEDLDLSYRAQLAGWEMEYSLDLACPAELPSNVDALEAEQRRWATGGTQTGVKLLRRIWFSPITLRRKLEATVHLTHYFVVFWMVFFALLARPVLVLVDTSSGYSPWFWVGWVLVTGGLLAAPITYGYARYCIGGGWSGVWTAPAVMLMGIGLSISNMLAVLRGLTTRGGEFIRTPKSGSTAVSQAVSRYKPSRYPVLWFVEMLAGAYCLANFAIAVGIGRVAFSVFLGFYAVGFLIIGWTSRPEAGGRRTRPMVVAQEEPVAVETEAVATR